VDEGPQLSLKTIDEVLEELIDIFNNAGQVDRSAGLEERRAVLQSARSSEADRRAALADLRGIINGIGGLNDLWLTPPEGSPQSRLALRAQMRELADRLWELTAED
jgi:hypothetical protein